MVSKASCTDGYIVEFYGVLNWQLIHNGREIFSFIEGKYTYRKPYHANSLQTMKSFLHLTTGLLKQKIV